MGRLWATTVRFAKEVRAELRRVVWPDRRTTALYTAVVVLSVTVVAALIWIVDSVLAAIITRVVH